MLFFVPIYSNIIILAASVFVAGDLMSPKLGHAGRSLVAPASQGAFFGMKSPTAVPFRAFLRQQELGPRLAQSKTSSTVAPPATVSIADPPFLRHPILFDPNSLEPNPIGKNLLKRAATWLREHREARVLIVGSCDSSGSETCTHALAEARGAAILEFLQRSGIRSDQVVGVKGWDNLEHNCPPAEIKCQQLSRSARIFIAGSLTPKEKP